MHILRVVIATLCCFCCCCSSKSQLLFFFWTDAALIITIVAVFATLGKKSLVDSQVLSLDGPLEARQPNSHQHKQELNQTTSKEHTKQTKQNQQEALLGKLMVKHDTKPRLSCCLRQQKVAFDTLDMVWIKRSERIEKSIT